MLFSQKKLNFIAYGSLNETALDYYESMIVIIINTITIMAVEFMVITVINIFITIFRIVR